MWTERSIHMLQLATQLLNHPGTSREAGFPTLPPGVTRISMTSARLLLCDNHFMQEICNSCLWCVSDIAMFACMPTYALLHMQCNQALLPYNVKLLSNLPWSPSLSDFANDVCASTPVCFCQTASPVGLTVVICLFDAYL